MGIYYGIKNPNSPTLLYDMNNRHVEIYETKEAAEVEALNVVGEVVEVFVTAKNLSETLVKIRNRLKAGDLDEWSLKALEQIAADAIGD